MANEAFAEKTTLIPGPSFQIELAALDALHPVHYSCRLLIFRCASSRQRDAQLAAFKFGLQALVQCCPILGGLVTPLSPDAPHGLEDWCNIVPDRGLELIVKDLQTSIESLERLEAAGLPPLQLPSNLLTPVPLGLDNTRPFAACKVQFSAIDGGTIISFAVSHSVTDGVGTDELLRVLSENIRLAQVQSGQGSARLAAEPAIGLDRSFLRNIRATSDLDILDHPAYKWKSTNPSDRAKHPFEATSPEVTVLLHISAANLARLKADATTAGAPFISTHDALCALMWRTVLLIRSRRSKAAQDLPASTPTSIFMPSDARRHLNLPQSYVGNAVYQLTARLDLGTLLSSPDGLQYAASTIRRAITAVTPTLVSNYMAKLKECWLGWQFMDTSSTTGFAMGTDWSSAPLYD